MIRPFVSNRDKYIFNSKKLAAKWHSAFDFSGLFAAWAHKHGNNDEKNIIWFLGVITMTWGT